MAAVEEVVDRVGLARDGGEDLQALRARATLVDTNVLESRAPLAGRMLTAARSFLWTVLKPK